MSQIILESTLRCPQCGYSQTETMPTNACVWYWECPGCHVLIQPRRGDCCVFCSYGNMPCPPLQASADSCCQPASTGENDEKH
jgi:hypothetical protein